MLFCCKQDTVLLNGWEAFTEHEDKCDCVTSNFLVRTAGWAADVLEIWKAGCQLPKRTCIKSNTSADLSPTVGITGQTFCKHVFSFFHFEHLCLFSYVEWTRKRKGYTKKNHK